MSDELRATIRAKLTAGTLRTDEAARTWFGHGEDAPCVACGRRVTRADRECEADFADGVTLRFHRECFYLWDDERRGEPGERAPDETSAITAAILPAALCLACIVEKTGAPSSHVCAFLKRVRPLVELTEAWGACGACAVVTTTYRIG